MILDTTLRDRLGILDRMKALSEIPWILAASRPFVAVPCRLFDGSIDVTLNLRDAFDG